jgi:hypothetical protein
VRFNSNRVFSYQVKLIGGSVKMVEWFRRDNTEGFDEKTLKEMNEEMDKIFENLSEEDKKNESYLDYLQEKILSKR